MANADDQKDDNPSFTFGVISQYIKDVSFENPKIVESVAKPQGAPEISVNVQVQADVVGENVYEVMLTIEAKATRETENVFLVELTYGGLFNLENTDEESLQPLLLIECPRLLFPFARNIVADLTRDGGMPPLLLNPVDFVELFRKRQVAPAASVN